MWEAERGAEDRLQKEVEEEARKKKEAEEEEIGKTIESFYGIDIYIVYTFVVVRLDVKSNKIQFNIYIVFCAFIFLIQPYVYIAFFGCLFIIQYYAYIRYTNSTISIQSYMRYTYTIVANMYNTARRGNS